MKKITFILTIALILFGCTKKVPVIGISAINMNTGDGSQVYTGNIIDSVGGSAIYLPLTTDSLTIDSLLNELDGIVIKGGEDVNPKLYGETAYTCGSTGWNDMRDSSDMMMIRAAIRKNIPMLAICRGSQAMNVALGGALIQDVGVYLGQNSKEEDITGIIDTLNHRVMVKGVNHYGRHALLVNQDSKWMFDIAEGPTYDIATGHHQAVDPNRLAPGITVAACTADGIVEAIEYKANTFAVGVQGHPEEDAFRLPHIKRLFAVFVDHCK